MLANSNFCTLLYFCTKSYGKVSDETAECPNQKLKSVEPRPKGVFRSLTTSRDVCTERYPGVEVADCSKQIELSETLEMMKKSHYFKYWVMVKSVAMETHFSQVEKQTFFKKSHINVVSVNSKFR